MGSREKNGRNGEDRFVVTPVTNGVFGSMVCDGTSDGLEFRSRPDWFGARDETCCFVFFVQVHESVVTRTFVRCAMDSCIKRSMPDQRQHRISFKRVVNCEC